MPGPLSQPKPLGKSQAKPRCPFDQEGGVPRTDHNTSNGLPSALNKMTARLEARRNAMPNPGSTKQEHIKPGSNR